MISNNSSAKGLKWIATAVVLGAMVIGGSFAIVPIVPKECKDTKDPSCRFPAIANDPSITAPVLIGDSVDSSGTATTAKTFQWKESCTITVTTFTKILDKCTRHTVVVRVTGTKGDTGTILIERLTCFAAGPTATARFKADVDSGLLLDLLGTTDIPTANIRIGGVNNWTAKINNCDVTGSNNDFKLQLHILDSGTFRFSITVEPL